MAITRVRNNTYYFSYPEYSRLFGQNHRPAIIRHSIKVVRSRYQEEEDHFYLVHRIYIDGKVIEVSESISPEQQDCPSPGIVIVAPYRAEHQYYGRTEETDMVAKPFNPTAVDDWFNLLWDTKELERLQVPMSFAQLAFALWRYDINVQIISSALNKISGEAKERLLNCIEYVAWSLSQEKIVQLKGMLQRFGRNPQIWFPQDLTVAGRAIDVDSIKLSVHEYADKVIEKAEENKGQKAEKKGGLLELTSWLQDETASLSIDAIDRYNPYVGEDTRNLILKRYFHDVKRGTARYDASLPRIFTSRNYLYYPVFRYIYESYPERRRVEAEFLIDCLQTYEATNQQHFQISDGVLDWAVRKSIEKNSPLELNFYQWLSVCEGGIIKDPDFKGFAEFEIKYELNEFMFEEKESLSSCIRELINRYCTQKWHQEEHPDLDVTSGLPIFDPKTNKPKMHLVTVMDPIWRFKTQDKEIVDLFIDWDCKEQLEPNTFREEMIRLEMVEEKVRDYFNRHFGGIEIWLSQRKEEHVVKSFAMRVGMRARMYGDTEIGKDFGINLTEVKERIRNRLKELLGVSLECEYDPRILNQAQAESLYNPYGRHDTLFVTKQQKYHYGARYCAAELADHANLLTGKKCAICQKNEMCFWTSIKREPEWKDYKLLHILNIIGYQAMEETDAGMIPSAVYTTFVLQINKAISFYRRLVCKECGHLLFPSRRHYYKCQHALCGQRDKDVYLNWCHNCKKGVIDSRETSKCPNGWYICPTCSSCCSDKLLESLVIKYQVQGLAIPLGLSAVVGKGHAERNMVFCYKCGAQKLERENGRGSGDLFCPNCDTPQTGNVPPPPTLDDYY